MFEFFKKSVAAKVSVVISLMVLLTAVVVGTLFYFSGNQLFQTREFNDIRLYSKFVNFNLVQTHERLESLGLTVKELKKQNKPLRDSAFFKGLFESNPKVTAVQVFTESGNLIDAKYSNGIEKMDPLFPQESEELKAIGRGLSLAPITLAKLSGKSIKPFKPLLRVVSDLGKRKVVLAVDFSKVISNFNTEQIRGSFFILYNSEGDIIFHPNELKQYSTEKLVTYNIKQEFIKADVLPFLNNSSIRKDEVETIYRGEPALLHLRKVYYDDHFIMGVATGIPKRLALNFSPAFRKENIIISALLLIGFTLLGWFFTRYLFRNLDEITEQAKLFTQGEHDINIEVKSSDEIGILALTFQGMIRQVNERTRILRKSERRIREARDQAEQALSAKSQLLEDLRSQKSEVERVSKDKDDLLAIVSHDLKNPLAVVETSMDIILEEEKESLSNMAEDLVRRSKSSARVALNLITDLLDLSRLEGGIRLDFERFSVDEMIDSVVDSFYLKSSQKNITIDVIKKDSYDLIADYGRVIQVLSNILGNSLKFTPEDGHIQIEVGEYETSHDYEGNHSGLEIKISDNGPGIPKGKIDKIFNKFEQARKKDREVGTGLGLTICKNICDLHNGEISASSKSGHGATFIIRLPRLLNTQEKIQEKEKGNYTVLLVNDSGDFRKRARTGLAAQGYRVLEAKNGEEMLKILDSESPDLIILDKNMPVKNGVDSLKELKDKGLVHVPIIFLASHIYEGESSLIRSMVTDVLSEDVSVNELEVRVSSILNPDSMTSLEKKLDPSKRTILIVDDEEGIRGLLRENFSFLGYNSIVAKNGVEGLFLIQKYRIDLVVSDIRMTEVDGLTLTKAIRKDYPSLPVVLMSANVDGLSENLTERLGIIRMFPKPFDIDELNQFVRQTIGGAFLKENQKVIREKKKDKKEEVVETQQIEERSESPETTSRAEMEATLKAQKKEAIAPEKGKILLVDDSEDMQTLFKVLMRKENYDIDVASNGLESLEFVKFNEYDLIFMDMNMPIMGGEEAVLKIREFEKSEERKNAYITLLTADSLEEEAYKNMGFNSYIKKPLNKKKILQEMEDAAI